jgi:hypothetical protein
MGLQALLTMSFLVAEVMLFYTPSKADARGSLIAALTLHTLPLLALILWFMVPSLGLDPQVAPRLSEFMLIGAHVSFWLGFIMLITYLKQFYYYLNDQPSGNTISTLGLFYVIVAVLGYVLFFVNKYVLVDGLYFILTPAWFFWDGGLARIHLLLLRQMQKLRKRVTRIVYPDVDWEEVDKQEQEQKKRKSR